MFSLLLLDKMTTKSNNILVQDSAIILFSIILAYIMVQTQLLDNFINTAKSFRVIGSFIAGIFFTTVFTTAPAIVTLGEIAREGSVLLTALLGALGATIGDLIIFRFIRDRLSEHLADMLKHERWWRRVRHIFFHQRYFRWLTFLIGGAILASPLPDELGVSLLGISRMRTKHFVSISFLFNFIGILVIGIVAKSL